MTHTHPIRVYYEDIDLGGIVYYANYLKFIERGRSEWIRAMGVDQGRLRAEAGVVFAVRRLLAEYLAPARFDDQLDVTTEFIAETGARIELRQAVLRGQQRLFAAEVTLVCVDDAGRAGRIPADFRRKIAVSGAA